MNNRDILYFDNFDTVNQVTPVKFNTLDSLLKTTGYPHEDREFLIQGFRNGFSLGYQGPTNVVQTAPNLEFRIGDEIDLWNKIMKEVGLKRFAGPFKRVPFKYFIQSPLGLVPKDGGKNMRLIFHLSYPRGLNNKSVNANIPKELCSVQYPDFSSAVELCMGEGQGCHIVKSDVSMAFRNLNILRKHWRFLVMKARSPLDGEWYQFFNKCLPFGSSISCSLYQKFSNCIAHIVAYYTKKPLVNYLDDYYFCALLKAMCNGQVEEFLRICKLINLPVSVDKTY